MADHTKVPVQDLRPDGTFTPARAAARFSSEEFADAAIEFLRRPPDGRPSLAYIAFTAPHDPRNPPEDWRARYHADLPPLREFILPGGSRAAALAHVARTVCRRAERTLVSLRQGGDAQALPVQYLNRLSDLLFVLARVLNRADGGNDILWQQGRKPD